MVRLSSSDAFDNDMRVLGYTCLDVIRNFVGKREASSIER